MFSQRPFAQDSRPYAIPADFCRIFEHDMNRLYLLSYLLTADHRMAETCFVRGLEDATRSNRVFREWAGSWARRMIIQDAIQTVRPLASNDSVFDARSHEVPDKPRAISAVVGLPAFERFVFVMTVLDRYSHQECSLLLGCSREDVITARVRALQHIGEAAQGVQNPDRIGRSDALIPQLAVSA